MYDNCINDLGENVFHLLGNFADADKTVQLFREGYTMMMLDTKDMHRVEQCVKDEVPFIIVVLLNDDTIFAVVNGDDVTY